jgi:glycosyltransferase involved in cell wall biosynthesis
LGVKEFTQRNDIEVFLACPKSSRLYKIASKTNETNLFPIDFPSKIKEFNGILKNTKMLAKLIKKHKFDILHVNGTPDHKMAMYCKIFYGLDYKIIRTKHESKDIKNNLLAMTQYKKFMDKMIVVSNFQLKTIKKRFILDKTTVIHNGIDLEYFKPKIKNQNFLNNFNIKNEKIVFVSVAGTALHKGWHYLVNAISTLDENQKNKIKIILAGNYPKEDVVKKYIEDKNMQDNVIFTGLIDDVRDIISIGDVGFVLSSAETISFACREMMAMGKPVIVSNCTGLPENIDNNINGWIIDVKDKYSLKNTIEQIINNDIRLDFFSKEALIKAKKEFGMDNFINKTYIAYKEVLDDQNI